MSPTQKYYLREDILLTLFIFYNCFVLATTAGFIYGMYRLLECFH